MTNPYDTTPTPIDIREAADRVIAQLRDRQYAAAFLVLEREREGQRTVVQEALDRYVMAGARTELEEFARSSAPIMQPALGATLVRLQQATAEPRMPVYIQRSGPDIPNELNGLTDAQIHDVYASIVEARGTQSARDAIHRNNESVLLGLRQENSTLDSANNRHTGVGVYNDQLVALRRERDGTRSVYIAEQANTEPTAQYDHHAGSNGTRRFDGRTGPVAPRTPTSPGFEDVRHPRHIEGRDADGDGIRDLGRLQPGTIEMVRAYHGEDNHRSFRPSSASVAQGQGQVRRDTNGDGRFDSNDVNGLDDLNNTFKIHRGSANSTDSAGCQTIRPDRFERFMDMAYGDEATRTQTRWQYVLTDARTGDVRTVEAPVPQNGNPAQPPPQPAAPDRHGPQAAPHDAAPGRPPAPDQRGEPQVFNLLPRTAEDDYLDRFFATTERGDMNARAALTRDYGQQPHVQAQDHEARNELAMERELAQQQEAQLLAQQQEQTHERSRGRSM